jgi:hypothetical protein
LSIIDLPRDENANSSFQLLKYSFGKEDNEKLDDLITQIPAANKVYMMIPIIGESSTRRFESSGERFVCIVHLLGIF